MMNLVLIILSVVLLLEIVLWVTISLLSRNFQWLITGKDIHPKFDEAGLGRFIKHGFDGELGWVRKPNTAHPEKSRFGTTHYAINKLGARSHPGLEDQVPKILAVGDSYTFCRQANDDETWPYYLSSDLSGNVLNFGVGNYGLDQSFLRLQRELPKHPEITTVILGVVPETISRIQCVWKHYSEYGNIFAFKPRFVYDEGKLQLIPNVIDSPEKFADWQDFEPELQKNDYFFKRKFIRDILKFPYLYTLSRSANRNLPLIWALLKRIFSPTDENTHRPYQMVLERNHDIAAQLYKDERAVNLMAQITQRYAEYCSSHNVRAIFCMLPQKNDLQRIASGDFFYQPFVDKVREVVDVVDFGRVLLESDSDINAIYTEDYYGGHLAPESNRLVADILTEYLKTTSTGPPERRSLEH